MASPKEKLLNRLHILPRLRGRGPVSYDYGQWVDSTHHVLITLFGGESAQARGFLDLVGEGAEARGWGLPLAPGNPWGMQARLDRAEEYLRGVLSSLGEKPPT
jgi:hypothetical protein